MWPGLGDLLSVEEKDLGELIRSHLDVRLGFGSGRIRRQDSNGMAVIVWQVDWRCGRSGIEEEENVWFHAFHSLLRVASWAGAIDFNRL
jgi:hypothetical protein